MTLLIFDCDGVLVDSEPIAIALLCEMLARLGHPMSAEEAMRRFAGRRLDDVRAMIEQLTGRPIPDEVGRRFGADLLDQFRRELKPMPGVREAIAALPCRRCVASSSAFDRLKPSLEITGLAPLFGPHVFSATQVPRGKPAPDLFLFAAGKMGATPAACIVIEDSPLGIEAARAAGMAAIGFVAHAGDDLAERLAAAGAAPVLHHMSELPTAVEALIRATRAAPI